MASRSRNSIYSNVLRNCVSQDGVVILCHEYPPTKGTSFSSHVRLSEQVKGHLSPQINKRFQYCMSYNHTTIKQYIIFQGNVQR